LEEVLEADIVVQVLDVANDDNKKQRQDVLDVLHSLGLERIEYQDNYIEVYNKVDLLGDDQVNKLRNSDNVIAISALNGTGCEELLKRIDAILCAEYQTMDIEVSAADGKMIAWLHNNAEILENKLDNDKIYMRIRIKNIDIGKLQKMQDKA